MSVAVQDLIKVLDTPEVSGPLAVPVTGVTHDSRKVRPGDLFAAISGEKTDGYNYVAKALTAGAVAVLAERPRPSFMPRTVPWIRVPHVRRVLGLIAAEVYGRPSEQLTVVGITGTNGKTTLTYLLEAIIAVAGGSPAVLGTVSYRWGTQESLAAHTTPEASDLQEMFRSMVDGGVTHACIEVSSHGLDQGRVDGCHFDVGVFTNLTQDHLDYHGSLEQYYLAKRLLFERFLRCSRKPRRIAVVNLDDPYGQRLVKEIQNIPIVGFGSTSEAPVRPEEVSITPAGITGIIRTPGGAIPFASALTGSFNLQNILAAVAVAGALALPEQAIQEGIARIHRVPGRLERIPIPVGTAFVDYAHTPDALRNVLAALQGITRGRIITVMGCGGDRDKTKRGPMGREAAAGSDVVVVTSDNPRTENPLSIIRAVEQGVAGYGFVPGEIWGNGRPLPRGRYVVIPDRRQAIAWAVRQLTEQDVLLVAGKGHETYQEIQGKRYPFDDREVLKEECSKFFSSGCSHDRTHEVRGAVLNPRDLHGIDQWVDTHTGTGGSSFCGGVSLPSGESETRRS